MFLGCRVLLLRLGRGGLALAEVDPPGHRRAGPLRPSARSPSPAVAGDLPEPVRRYLDFALGSRAGPADPRRAPRAGRGLRPPSRRLEAVLRGPALPPPAARLRLGRPDRLRPAAGRPRARRLRRRPRARSRPASWASCRWPTLSGGGELAVASLQRFLAELPWLPTALQPSARSAVDRDRRPPRAGHPGSTARSRPRPISSSATGERSWGSRRLRSRAVGERDGGDALGRALLGLPRASPVSSCRIRPRWPGSCRKDVFPTGGPRIRRFELDRG